jgi:hypothetical protein
MNRYATLLVGLVLAACAAPSFDTREARDTEQGSRKHGDDDRGSTDGPSEDDPLAPYLLSLGAAKRLAMAEPYIAPGGTPEAPDPYSPFAELTPVFQELVDGAMAQKAVAPGRTLTVTLATDTRVQAYGTAYQQVIVKRGFVEKVDDPIQAASVLCHEMVHTLMNDSIDIGAFQESMSAKLKEATDLETEYMGKTFAQDPQTLVWTYTHDEAAYREMLPKWQALQEPLSTFHKKTESVADIVGGELCGVIGLSREAYIAGMKKDFALNAGILASFEMKLEDGKAYTMAANDALDWIRFYLFRLDTHPTDVERGAQLDRVGELFVQSRSQASWIARWAAEYEAARSRVVP